MDKCEAEQTERGLNCPGKSCGACVIGKLKDEAEELGYKVFVVPGGSLIKKIAEEEDPEAVLGVACFEEVEVGINVIEKRGVPVQAVLLDKAGCVNTEVNEKRVMDKIRLGTGKEESEG